MAALQSLRNRAGLITGVIAVALFLFVINDLDFNKLFGNDNEVGEIDGQVIKYEPDFRQKMADREEYVKIVNGQTSLPDEYQARVRESVWSECIRDISFGKVYENAGIEVTDDEMSDMVTGNHIAQAFYPLFGNPQTGAYDKNMAVNFIQNITSAEALAENPNLAKYAFIWNVTANDAKNQRLYGKYMTILNKSIYCTEAQAKLEASKRTKDVDLAVVAVRYTSLPDSTITVSDSEIKARYNELKENLRVDENRNIEFVSFPIRPTDLDRENTLKAVEDLKVALAEAEDAHSFAANNAETPMVERYMTKEQLPANLASFVESAQAGDVYGPYREGESFKISRLVAVAQRPDSVKASHILIAQNPKAVNVDSLFEAMKNGGDFAKAARDFSEDGGSAINGGDLDWFADGVMVPEFNEACFTGVKGSVVKVQTRYGVHIIKIVDKGATVQKYSVATIDKAIVYGSQTDNDVYTSALAFKDNASKTSFDAAVDSMNLVKRYGNGIRSNAHSVTTLRSARELVKWAFKADEGEVSKEIFKIDDNYVVAIVAKIQEKGYASLEDAKPMITRDLMNEKKAQVVAKAVEGKTLDEIAAMYNAKVDTMHNINFAASYVSGAGNEPALVGKVASLKQGARVNGLKGNNAAYVVEVAADKTHDYTVQAAKDAYIQQFQSFERQVNDVITDVEVEDHRYNFF